MSGADSSRGGPRIIVDQPAALYDRAVAIGVEGLVPGNPMTLTATFHIPGSVPWRSSATFTADGDGRVDLTRQAPVTGRYRGVAPMGLFWSASPVRGETPAAPDGIMGPRTVRLEVESAGLSRADVTLERRWAGPGVSRHVVNEGGVIGTLFLPAAAGRHPAVIVLGGSDGISEHRSALLASHGYAALSLAYFRGQGLPPSLVNIPLEYFENAVQWMRAQIWLRDHVLAVWGVSRSGELALLIGSTIPEINAVVAYVPSGVLHGGFGPDDASRDGLCAAWSYRGRPLPYLPENNAADDPASVDYGASAVAEAARYLAQLRDADAVERATIAVEKIRGPVLLVSGEDDPERLRPPHRRHPVRVGRQARSRRRGRRRRLAPRARLPRGEPPRPRVNRPRRGPVVVGALFHSRRGHCRDDSLRDHRGDPNDQRRDLSEVLCGLSVEPISSGDRAFLAELLVLVRMETFMDDRQIFGPEQRARRLILEKIQSSGVYGCGRRREVADDRRIVGLRDHVLDDELHEERTVVWSS